MDYNQDYDDEHDDEIESRLYEQIYYSNTIIGEENNVTNLVDNLDPTNNTSSNLQTRSNENASSNESPKSPNTQLNKINQTSSSSQDTNVLKKLVEEPNTKKRLSTDDDTNKHSKKRKVDDAKSTNKISTQSNEFNFSPKTSSTPVSNRIKSLSKNEVVNKNSKQIPTSSKKGLNEKQDESADLEDTVIIVDLTSESSKDSLEDDSKYNVTPSIQKKLEAQKSKLKNTNSNADSDDSSSDSEESIFEVPVPPKPKPPLIELKDSDNESNVDISSDEDETTVTKQKLVIKNSEVSLQEKSSSDQIYDIDSDSNDEPNNLVLNCTEIQKGASSLSEIKRLSSQDSSKVKSAPETCTNVPNTSVELNDSFTFKKPAKPVSQTQIKNTNAISRNDFLNNKKVGGSKEPMRQNSNKKNISPEEYFFQPMNDNMKSFYNDSWGGENFDVNELKKEMSADPNKWAILDDDIALIGLQRRRYFGPTCSRCQKNGHKQYQCPEERSKIPICHMCGMSGHYDYACPDKQCLTCGQRQIAYKKTCNNCQRLQCFRCHSTGHLENACPDLWRRFHDTTSNVNAEIPGNPRNVMKPQHQLYCCNCAKRGHDSSNCRKLRWSQHFINPSFVSDYNGPPYLENPPDDYDSDEFLDSSFNSSSGYDSENLNTSFDSYNGNSSRNSNDSFEYDKNNSSFKVLCRIKSDNMRKPNSKSKKFSVGLQKIYEYSEWEKLSNFLRSFSSCIQSEFTFVDKNQNISINCAVPQEHVKYLRKIMTQYSTRNNYERSQMMLNWDRSSLTHVSQFSQKFNEMKHCDLDVLETHGRSLQLKKEIKESNGSLASNVIQLASCRQKLLLFLYSNGYIDNAFKHLKKLHDKMVRSENNKTRRELVVKGNSLLSIKCLLQYIHYYNKVFTPYEIPSLNFIVDKYSKHMDLREKLRNDPKLFPPQKNSSTEANRNDLSQDKNSDLLMTISREPMTNNEISLASSSRSEIPSLLSINPAEFSLQSSQEPTTSGNVPQKNEHKDVRKPQVPSLFVGNTYVKPNPLYVQFSQCKSPHKKKMFEKKFKKFIQGAKSLISEAQKLNIPDLQKHINVLEKKLQNEIYVTGNDVNILRLLIKKHTKPMNGNHSNFYRKRKNLM